MHWLGIVYRRTFKVEHRIRAEALGEHELRKNNFGIGRWYGFYGRSIGVPGHTVGEVVFNTAMTGYQEILTDPNYAQQIVTLTYPHIGNTGTNDEIQSQVASIKCGQMDWLSVIWPWRPVTFAQSQSLNEYLINHNTVAIADIDTQNSLILREKGAQNSLYHDRR